MKANMRNPLKAIEEIVARLTRSLILLSLTLYVLFSAQQVLGYKWFSLGLLLILISDFIAACDWPSGKMKTAAVYN